jgi:hypothetical protein
MYEQGRYDGIRRRPVFSFCFVFGGIGVGTKGFVLAKQVLYLLEPHLQFLVF